MDYITKKLNTLTKSRNNENPDNFSIDESIPQSLPKSKSQTSIQSISPIQSLSKQQSASRKQSITKKILQHQFYQQQQLVQN